VALLFPLSVALWPLGVSLRVAVRESERVFSADAVFEAVLERVEVGVPVALGVPPRAAEADTVRVGVREGRGVRLEEGEGVGEAVWDGEALGEGRALGQGVGESVEAAESVALQRFFTDVSCRPYVVYAIRNT
jgi:hypothetical protein